MRFFRKEDMTTKERRNALIQSFLGLIGLVLFAAFIAWGGAFILGLLGTTLSNTAKQYSIPEKVVDEHREIIRGYFLSFGGCVFLLTLVAFWILVLLREMFHVLRNHESRTGEPEKGNGKHT